MANVKNAKKKVKQINKVTLANQQLKSTVKNAIKETDKAVAAGNKERAEDRLPEPTFNYMDIKVKDGDFITMVELDPVEHEKKISSKTVNTTVTMPEWLKNLADMKGINFSKLLQESLKNELNLL